jgi:hypothetical protein
MLVRAYSEIRQEAQKCPEKIPKKFGGKRFLDGNGRENGSLPLSVALERRERKRVSAVFSLNPAFLSPTFACGKRLRDLSIASR